LHVLFTMAATVAIRSLQTHVCLLCSMRVRVGKCVAAIRLHVLIMLSTAITAVVAHGRNVLARESVRERDPTLQALLRNLHRIDEEVRPASSWLTAAPCLPFITSSLIRPSLRKH
jgi:hypothetical protein